MEVVEIPNRKPTGGSLDLTWCDLAGSHRKIFMWALEFYVIFFFFTKYAVFIFVIAFIFLPRKSNMRSFSPIFYLSFCLFFSLSHNFCCFWNLIPQFLFLLFITNPEIARFSIGEKSDLYCLCQIFSRLRNFHFWRNW